ncbi:hypothetical protein ACVNP0_04125 [Staphylococcus aureus]
MTQHGPDAEAEKYLTLPTSTSAIELISRIGLSRLTDGHRSNDSPF